MRAVINAAPDPAAVPAPSGDAAAFHRRLPGYAPTPLHQLDHVCPRQAWQSASLELPRLPASAPSRLIPAIPIFGIVSKLVGRRERCSSLRKAPEVVTRPRS